jgi:hypothetical protein
MRLVLIVLAALFCISAQDRRPSPPYITGDGFRAHCRFVFDEKNHKTFPYSQVQKGDTVFVNTDYLPRFFKKYHPHIKKPYILVTHNSDLAIPGAFAHYLNDPKILAWFGQNVEEVIHPKLHPIPIGLENRYNSNGNPDVVTQAKKDCLGLVKRGLLYSNFTIGTCPTERGFVAQLFKDKPFCISSSRKPYPEYLKDLAETKFILCPRGNGLDCHRTWESLYLGSIPIVRTSASDALYTHLPVIIVSDWNEVTEEFLHQKYEELQSKSFAYEHLTLEFWTRFIDSHKPKK